MNALKLILGGLGDFYQQWLRPLAGKALSFTGRRVGSLGSDILSTHKGRKFVEVVERSIEWCFVALVVGVEAVTGIRNQRRKDGDFAPYPNPWKGFSFSGEAKLDIFTVYPVPVVSEAEVGGGS